MVELVRIILHFRNDEGHHLELRIKSEVTEGGLRERNQPLAVVLRNKEHGEWEQAVLTSERSLSLEKLYNMYISCCNSNTKRGSYNIYIGYKYKVYVLNSIFEVERCFNTKFGLSCLPEAP